MKKEIIQVLNVKVLNPLLDVFIEETLSSGR